MSDKHLLDMVTYMSLSNTGNKYKHLVGMNPFVFNGAHALIDFPHAHSDKEFAPGISVIGNSDEDGILAVLCKLTTVSADRSKRRFVGRPDCVFKLETAMIDNDGGVIGETLYFSINGNNWAQSFIKGKTRNVLPDDIAQSMKETAITICKIQRDIPATWQVSMRFVDSPEVVFDTDPIGAQEVFALRDIPNGATRRAALLHWVSAHWRRKPAQEGNAWVRPFLRGATKFVWNGLRCEITPSLQDALDAGWKSKYRR